MRNRYANRLRIASLMIVLTVCGWQQSQAQQTFRSTAYRAASFYQETQEEGAQLPPPQLEQIPSTDPEPEIYVEDRFCGWQAAGLGSGVARLSDELRANWVMVDDNGLLTGTVVGLKPAADPNAPASQENVPEPVPAGSPDPSTADQNQPPKVGMRVFLLNRGRLLTSTPIDGENRFEFQGVKPGTYSLVGYGPSGFFAFGLNVLPYVADSNQPRELYVPAITSTGKPITDWVTMNAPFVRFRNFDTLRFAEGKEDPPRLYGIQGLRTFTPEAKPATSIVSHPSYSTVDGRLLGRLHHINSLDGRPIDLRTTAVLLIKDGRIAYQTGTDNYGVFELANVSPGPYELLASGPDGIGAVQIEVVAGENPTAELIDLALISPETIGWINHYMHESAYIAAISGPRPDDECDRCGRKCSRCGGCGCQGRPCHCDHGYGDGQGGYGYPGYGTGYGTGSGYGFGGYDSSSHYGWGHPHGSW